MTENDGKKGQPGTLNEGYAPKSLYLNKAISDQNLSKKTAAPKAAFLNKPEPSVEKPVSQTDTPKKDP